MFEWNLWQSIEAALRLQRILCVSPFHLDHSTGKLKACWIFKLYTLSITLGLLIVMYLAEFHWNFIEVFVGLIPSGMVWRILCYYAIVSINTHFVLNMVIIGIGLKKHVKFLERIHMIDEQFKIDFNASVDHKDYKRKLSYALFSLYIFFSFQVIGGISFIVITGKYVLLPPTLVYGLEYLIINAQVYTMTNYLFLLRMRYLLTFSVYKTIHREYVLYLKSHKFNENMEDLFLMKLSKIFEIFREITHLIRLYNDIFGWLFVSHIIKTFMNILMELYVIFLTISENGIGMTGVLTAVDFSYIFIGELANMFWMIIAIHSVYAAVIFQ